MSDNHYDVIVVGAGPAGMMAAGQAAGGGKKVLLLEKNSVVGKKLSITGGGRCNITNHKLDFKHFLESFPTAKKFLYSPFSEFSVQDSIDFFNTQGLELVTQARERMFPQSERAPDVTAVMHKFCKQSGVTIKTKQTVTTVVKEHGSWRVSTKQSNFSCSSLILSTGGYAAPETGSTGEGFVWLEKLGHSITKPSPSIVPLATDSEWVHRLSGLDWSFLKMRIYADDKQASSKTGKLLFTHFGISGPMVLNSSKEVADLLAWADSVVCSLDLYPDTDFADLDKRMVKLFDSSPRKTTLNTLSTMLPKQLTIELLGLLKIETDLPSGDIDREKRKALVALLKDLRFPITGTLGFDRAVIADGGVALEEIDTSTMESRLNPDLYIIGDLLNINRPSGGYSLQLCWTTGYVAGTHA